MNNQAHYESEIRELLSSRTLRIFFWRLIVEECRVFQSDFTFNASAYALLAKQEIGKRLLADAKAIHPEGVIQAEKDYNQFITEMAEEALRRMQQEGEEDYG